MTDISAFKKVRILVVGDVMLDRYWWGSVNRISPEAPVPIVRLDRETTRSGGAANVAANAHALGAEVRLVGIAGDDNDGDKLIAQISALGIDSRDLFKSPDRRTIVKTRVIAHNQQVVRLDSEDVGPATAAERDAIVGGVGGGLAETDLVILSDYGKGCLSDDVVKSIIAECTRRNIPVIADPKGKNFEKYSGATVLTPNRREAAEACKFEEADPDLVQRAGAALLTEFNLANVLITESENGMSLFQRGNARVHFPTAAREVYDVTGAGDTVIACLGVGLAAGLSVEDAARVSNVSAGVSVQHIGTVAVSFDELQSELGRADSIDSRI